MCIRDRPWRRPRRQNDVDRFHTGMNINPDIFKAYDIRGLYPAELNEEIARQIGRGFAAYLQPKAIAVSRDMRVSSPAIAAAFIDGVLMQGVDVIDYGMLGTDQLYFAVVEDGLDGGAQITASHNPGRYNGIKMVRSGAMPLSGDAGIAVSYTHLRAHETPEHLVCRL